MPDGERLLRVGFLNVVATPHPVGVYERLFRRAANNPVRFWGENRAAITSIRARSGEAGIFTGQILIWVEIDPKSPAVDKSLLTETPLTDDARRLTNAFGFNSRVFRFVLDAAQHRVSIEALNELGHTLSPRRALSIFDRVLSPAALGADAELVEVSVIPEDDALSYVLALPRLDRVDILVKLPNPDDVSPETEEVLAELRAQNARRQEIVLSRAAKTDGLELNERNDKLARVASDGNGHVTTKGINRDGESETRSTREYPKIVERIILGTGTFLSTLVDIAKDARPSRARR